MSSYPHSAVAEIRDKSRKFLKCQGLGKSLSEKRRESVVDDRKGKNESLNREKTRGKADGEYEKGKGQIPIGVWPLVLTLHLASSSELAARSFLLRTGTGFVLRNRSRHRGGRVRLDLYSRHDPVQLVKEFRIIQCLGRDPRLFDSHRELVACTT